MMMTSGPAQHQSTTTLCCPMVDIAPVEMMGSGHRRTPLGSVTDMAIDVTDATFQEDVIHKSADVPVVIDLWAPWCGPCTTLGPILEKVIDATEGKVVLVKVNIDENPGIARAFQVQSIPAVYAMNNGQIVDGFLGAVPEREVQAFVDRLLPTQAQSEVASLIAAGDESSLRRATELEPGNEDAVVALAQLLVDQRQFDEALTLLERIPESDRTRPIAAAARLGDKPTDDYDVRLAELLPKVKGDDEARQQYVDILELMGADDPRTADYRKRLTRELF
jgi:putative thioredoxin